MLIDCDTCTVRGQGCDDCVVTVLLGAPPGWRGSDPTVVPLTRRPVLAADVDGEVDDAGVVAGLGATLVSGPRTSGRSLPGRSASERPASERPAPGGLVSGASHPRAPLSGRPLRGQPGSGAVLPGAPTAAGPEDSPDVLDTPGQTGDRTRGVVVEFDDVERRAVRALAEVGLVPPLRHQPPTSREVG